MHRKPRKPAEHPFYRRNILSRLRNTSLREHRRRRSWLLWPTVKVTGTESDKLRERYVYVDRETGRNIYISMVNAIVTGVQTSNP